MRLSPVVSFGAIRDALAAAADPAKASAISSAWPKPPERDNIPP